MMLRPYQVASVNTALNWLKGRRNCFALELPTGSGKSAVAGALALQIHKTSTPKRPRRILILSHLTQIVRQDAIEISRIVPIHSVGVISDGVGILNVRHASIMVGSIGTVLTRLSLLDGVTDLIVDEAHAVPPDQESEYAKLIAYLTERTPKLRIIGLTATTNRLDIGCITNKGGLFREIPLVIPAADLIRAGYMARQDIIPVPHHLVFRGENIPIAKDGDFELRKLETAMLASGMTGACLDYAIDKLDGVPSWLIFACGIRHAEYIAGHLNARLRPTIAVHSRMSDCEYQGALSLFARQQVHLVSVGKLTTGFNATNVRALVHLRKTKSWSLWHQMTGRGARVEPGKTSFKVLDFVGGIDEHGTIEDSSGAPVHRVRKVQECKSCGAVATGTLKRCACGSSLRVYKPLDRRSWADSSQSLSA